MNYEDIKTPEELYEFMKSNIKYGFVSSIDNKAYRRKELNNDELYDEILFKSYFLQTPKQLLENKCGLCYDQVEFAKRWFINHGYEVMTYYSDYKNHVILIYKDKDTYNLFERTIPLHNSIYRGKTLQDVLNIYKNMQFENKDVDTIKLYRYDEVNYGIGFWPFIDELKKGSEIIVLNKD